MLAERARRFLTMATSHLPRHTHHERRNTHYGACSTWFVVGGGCLGALFVGFCHFLVFFCIYLGGGEGICQGTPSEIFRPPSPLGQAVLNRC
jgi:hypothetical protein